MSLKSRLLSYLQRNPDRCVPSSELQRLAMEAGYSAQNAGRRLREMEVAGQILVTYGNKNAASYQYKLQGPFDYPKARTFCEDAVKEWDRKYEIAQPKQETLL